ncbi:MAG: hypothetical protein JW829_09145 [Pirellulales bacterium]|nr:hypothetical protein [Pirellulales bacterium]
MSHKAIRNHRGRRGVIVILSAIMTVVLVGLIAFSVDYGYLLKTRTDLQRAADASALAAVRDLIRKDDGTQDLDQVRSTVREYVSDNLEDMSFVVASEDIEIGRYDPQSIYSNLTLLNNGTFDTVRVTLRRDGTTNPAVRLFFARVLGTNQANITATATAVLQKAQIMNPGADVLPFATPKELWDDLEPGGTWIAYGDGKLKDAYGTDVPGNWGTVDIGSEDNSTDALNDQILHGLRQGDLDALYEDNRIPELTHIDSSIDSLMQGDTGLSVGLKSSVRAVHGCQRIVPIYDQLSGDLNGNNLEFHVVGWGVVTVIDSTWQGEVNTYVILRKSHIFQGELRPAGTLSSVSGAIDGAYTSPVLVE